MLASISGFTTTPSERAEWNTFPTSCLSSEVTTLGQPLLAEGTPALPWFVPKATMLSGRLRQGGKSSAWSAGAKAAAGLFGLRCGPE